ncbi:MAG: S-ribosylhomocysteine lyase, partial [Oscillospiraceae bacterium]|nr:S-ribosylhomocysteine lyase [Oscillospiraceae bacterium]
IRREECGNYKEHDLAGAKETAEDMLSVLANWTEDKLVYET